MLGNMHRPSPRTASGETEHSYLASAADLMIGLLFVFIIMVAFLALQKKAEQEAAALAIEAARQNAQDPRGSVTEAIGRAVQKTLPTVRVDPASGVISLPEDVLFDLGSSTLKDGAAGKLAQVANALSGVLACYVASERHGQPCATNPQGNEIETIFIEGHTDNRPMNRPGGNTKLSLDRAISVGDALVNRTSLDDFRNDQQQPVFSHSAYGDSRPLKNVDPSDGRNRRVDLRIVLKYRPQTAVAPWEAARAAQRAQK
ncbi:OmpA family protein [Variovorax sp. CF079]|uniref:OmpA/MotB family protein n=1 Tax=Variovorax sp. CF079 TaxID=1882774 RepID=UPI00088993C4|nr:OmpA family protein [Variovorax sp. CF079]SDC45111.1 OmpA family protein [Variovorax sp. CF079]